MSIFLKAMLITFAFIFAAVFIANPHIGAFINNLIEFMGIWVSIIALFVLSYLLSVLLVGKRYCMAFTMDNEKVVTLDRWELKSKLAKLEKETDVKTCDSKSAMDSYSFLQETYYSDVNRLVINEKKNKITLYSPLTIHLVYVNKEDIMEVWEFISSRCPQARQG